MPLPPIEEQARIVRVVAELNELLNRVEGEERLGELRRDRLVTASLHALTNDDSSENGSVQSFNNAARFCINHFPRLTARPEHVQQLRVSILDLAVREGLSGPKKKMIVQTRSLRGLEKNGKEELLNENLNLFHRFGSMELS